MGPRKIRIYVRNKDRYNPETRDRAFLFVDITDFAETTIGKVKEDIRRQCHNTLKIDELFLNNVSLANDRSVAHYNIEDGCILESTSNPFWVACLYVKALEIKQTQEANPYDAGIQRWTNQSLPKKYTLIGLLLNSKNDRARQPPHFPTLADFLQYLEVINKKGASMHPEYTQRDMLAFEKQYQEDYIDRYYDPIAEFIDHQAARLGQMSATVQRPVVNRGANNDRGAIYRGVGRANRAAANLGGANRGGVVNMAGINRGRAAITLAGRDGYNVNRGGANQVGATRGGINRGGRGSNRGRGANRSATDGYIDLDLDGAADGYGPALGSIGNAAVNVPAHAPARAATGNRRKQVRYCEDCEQAVAVLYCTECQGGLAMCKLCSDLLHAGASRRAHTLQDIDQAPKNSSKPYVPRAFLAPFAIVLAMYRSLNEGQLSMNESEIKSRAQQHTDTDLQDKQAGKYVGGFDCMENVLMLKGFVKKEAARVPSYALTAVGQALGEKLYVFFTHYIRFTEAHRIPNLPTTVRSRIHRRRRICLIVDQKERDKDRLIQYATGNNIDVQVRLLPAGDYVWILSPPLTDAGLPYTGTDYDDELMLPFIVERKSWQDFEYTTRTRRFLKQVFNMLGSGVENCFYLMEGSLASLRNLSTPQQQYLKYLLEKIISEDGFFVNYTSSWMKSAQWLMWLTDLIAEALQTGRVKDRWLISYRKFMSNVGFQRGSTCHKMSFIRTDRITHTWQGETFINHIVRNDHGEKTMLATVKDDLLGNNSNKGYRHMVVIQGLEKYNKNRSSMLSKCCEAVHASPDQAQNLIQDRLGQSVNSMVHFGVASYWQLYLQVMCGVYVVRTENQQDTATIQESFRIKTNTSPMPVVANNILPQPIPGCLDSTQMQLDAAAGIINTPRATPTRKIPRSKRGKATATASRGQGQPTPRGQGHGNNTSGINIDANFLDNSLNDDDGTEDGHTNSHAGHVIASGWKRHSSYNDYGATNDPVHTGVNFADIQPFSGQGYSLGSGTGSEVAMFVNNGIGNSGTRSMGRNRTSSATYTSSASGVGMSGIHTASSHKAASEQASNASVTLNAGDFIDSQNEDLIMSEVLAESQLDVKAPMASNEEELLRLAKEMSRRNTGAGNRQNMGAGNRPNTGEENVSANPMWDDVDPKSLTEEQQLQMVLERSLIKVEVPSLTSTQPLSDTNDLRNNSTVTKLIPDSVTCAGVTESKSGAIDENGKVRRQGVSVSHVSAHDVNDDKGPLRDALGLSKLGTPKNTESGVKGTENILEQTECARKKDRKRCHTDVDNESQNVNPGSSKGMKNEALNVSGDSGKDDRGMRIHAQGHTQMDDSLSEEEQLRLAIELSMTQTPEIKKEPKISNEDMSNTRRTMVKQEPGVINQVKVGSRETITSKCKVTSHDRVNHKENSAGNIENLQNPVENNMVTEDNDGKVIQRTPQIIKVEEKELKRTHGTIQVCHSPVKKIKLVEKGINVDESVVLKGRIKKGGYEASPRKKLRMVGEKGEQLNGNLNSRGLQADGPNKENIRSNEAIGNVITIDSQNSQEIVSEGDNVGIIIADVVDNTETIIVDDQQQTQSESVSGSNRIQPPVQCYNKPGDENFLSGQSMKVVATCNKETSDCSGDIDKGGIETDKSVPVQVASDMDKVNLDVAEKGTGDDDCIPPSPGKKQNLDLSISSSVHTPLSGRCNVLKSRTNFSPSIGANTQNLVHQSVACSSPKVGTDAENIDTKSGTNISHCVHTESLNKENSNTKAIGSDNEVNIHSMSNLSSSVNRKVSTWLIRNGSEDPEQFDLKANLFFDSDNEMDVNDDEVDGDEVDDGESIEDIFAEGALSTPVTDKTGVSPRERGAVGGGALSSQGSKTILDTQFMDETVGGTSEKNAVVDHRSSSKGSKIVKSTQTTDETVIGGVKVSKEDAALSSHGSKTVTLRKNTLDSDTKATAGDTTETITSVGGIVSCHGTSACTSRNQQVVGEIVSQEVPGEKKAPGTSVVSVSNEVKDSCKKQKDLIIESSVKVGENSTSDVVPDVADRIECSKDEVVENDKDICGEENKTLSSNKGDSEMDQDNTEQENTEKSKGDELDTKANEVNYESEMYEPDEIDVDFTPNTQELDSPDDKLDDSFDIAVIMSSDGVKKAEDGAENSGTKSSDNHNRSDDSVEMLGSKTNNKSDKPAVSGETGDDVVEAIDIDLTEDSQDDLPPVSGFLHTSKSDNGQNAGTKSDTDKLGNDRDKNSDKRSSGVGSKVQVGSNVEDEIIILDEDSQENADSSDDSIILTSNISPIGDNISKTNKSVDADAQFARLLQDEYDREQDERAAERSLIDDEYIARQLDKSINKGTSVGAKGDNVGVNVQGDKSSVNSKAKAGCDAIHASRQFNVHHAQGSNKNLPHSQLHHVSLTNAVVADFLKPSSSVNPPNLPQKSWNSGGTRTPATPGCSGDAASSMLDSPRKELAKIEQWGRLLAGDDRLDQQIHDLEVDDDAASCSSYGSGSNTTPSRDSPGSLSSFKKMVAQHRASKATALKQLQEYRQLQMQRFQHGHMSQGTPARTASTGTASPSKARPGSRPSPSKARPWSTQSPAVSASSVRTSTATEAYDDVIILDDDIVTSGTVDAPVSDQSASGGTVDDTSTDSGAGKTRQTFRERLANPFSDPQPSQSTSTQPLSSGQSQSSKTDHTYGSGQSTSSIQTQKTSNIKCGNCGGIGHNRTFSNCPKYNTPEETARRKEKQAKMKEKQEERKKQEVDTINMLSEHKQVLESMTSQIQLEMQAIQRRLQQRASELESQVNSRVKKIEKARKTKKK